SSDLAVARGDHQRAFAKVEARRAHRPQQHAVDAGILVAVEGFGARLTFDVFAPELPGAESPAASAGAAQLAEVDGVGAGEAVDRQAGLAIRHAGGLAHAHEVALEAHHLAFRARTEVPVRHRAAKARQSHLQFDHVRALAPALERSVAVLL